MEVKKGTMILYGQYDGSKYCRAKVLDNVNTEVDEGRVELEVFYPGKDSTKITSVPYKNAVDNLEEVAHWRFQDSKDIAFV